MKKNKLLYILYAVIICNLSACSEPKTEDQLENNATSEKEAEQNSAKKISEQDAHKIVSVDTESLPDDDSVREPSATSLITEEDLTTQQDTVKPDTLKQDTVKQDTAKQDATKQDAPKRDFEFALEKQINQTENEIEKIQEETKTSQQKMEDNKKNTQEDAEEPPLKEDTEAKDQKNATEKDSEQQSKTDVNKMITLDSLSGTSGERILTIGNNMAIQTKEIIKGSCWDYINAMYNRAGYPANKRETVHKGTKDEGPYVDVTKIKAGDWLYYINHSYNGIEHSGVFVNWVDKSKKIANILSYGGEHRQEPGRYKNYDLSNTYTIIRAKSNMIEPSITKSSVTKSSVTKSH